MKKVKDSEKWYIEAQSRELAERKAQKRLNELREVGIEGSVDFVQIDTQASDTVAIRDGHSDEDVGAIYLFKFQKEFDTAEEEER